MLALELVTDVLPLVALVVFNPITRFNVETMPGLGTVIYSIEVRVPIIGIRPIRVSFEEQLFSEGRYQTQTHIQRYQDSDSPLLAESVRLKVFQRIHLNNSSASDASPTIALSVES